MQNDPIERDPVGRAAGTGGLRSELTDNRGGGSGRKRSRHRRLRGAITARAGSATAAAIMAILLVGAQATWAAGSSLTVVGSPNVSGSNYDELDAVATASAANEWAVGFSRVGNGPFRALIERWNGSTWTIVPGASRPASDDTRLHGVTALSSTDVWAVGSDVSSSLVEHFDGTRWAVIPRASGEPNSAELMSAAAVSATDIWMVGDVSGPGTYEPLIEHWDGTALHVVASAPISSTGHDFLLGVAAAGHADVWAVGQTGRRPTPIIEHFNGSSWTQVPQPASGYDSSLRSASVVSSNDVWAVGSQNLSQTVTEHWNGTRWSLVPSPFPTHDYAQNTLTGVVALSSGDVWAVGQTLLGFSEYQTLAEHWNGSAWSIIASANPSSGVNRLEAVGGQGVGKQLFAVGTYATSTGTYRTLVLGGTG